MIVCVLVLLSAGIGSALALYRGHGGPVRALAMLPDGKGFASGSFDGSVILWSIDAETAEAVLRGHDSAVASIVALPDGRVASGGEDGRIIIWGPADAMQIWTGHAGPVVALALSPDGRHLASASWDRTVRIWSLADGSSLASEPQGDNVNAVAFSPDGRHLFSAGYDGTLRAYDPRTLQQSLKLTLPTPLNALAIAADGQILVGGADGRLRFLSPDGTPQGDIEVLPGPINTLALSPDGRQIAMAGLRGAVTMMDRASHAITATLVGPGLPVWSMAYSRDSQVLFTGGSDRLIRRWSAARSVALDPVMPEPRATGEEAERGAQVFRACRACHTVTPDGGNRAGPSLHGLFGRRIATASGYRYSPALTAMDIVWTPETVARLFELGPAAYTPGSRMPEQQLSDPEDRQALVEWLQKVTRD